MSVVHWLEQAQVDVPSCDDWLSANELVRQQGFRFMKRRSDWRLGRWTAKRAVAACLSMSDHHETLQTVEVRAARDGAPEVILANKPSPLTISLSHRASFALCAVSLSGALLGCDLEVIEPRSDAFVSDYFTAGEQALVAEASEHARATILALLWSGKESTLKALRTGLRVDTRDLTVGFDQDSAQQVLTNWSPLHAIYHRARVLHGWWSQSGILVRTLVVDPRPEGLHQLDVAPRYTVADE
jgi:4'-phosphopantetheinyl transferase